MLTQNYLKYSSIMKNAAVVLLVAFATFMAPRSVDAAPFSIAAVGVADWAGVDASSSSILDRGLEMDNEWSFGGGLLFDIPVHDMISIGTGALYVYRKYSLSNANGALERRIPTIFVPLEAKFWFFNFFNVGLGGFTGVRVGSAQDEVSRGGLANAANPDHERFDYGVTGSLGVLIPVKDRTGIVLGGRYMYGLNNGSRADGYSEYLRDLVLTAGINFAIK